MSDLSVDRVEMRLRTDATVTIHDATGQAVHWIKPGAEMACQWPGMPTEVEMVLQYEALQKMVAATLEAQIVLTSEQLRKARQQRD